MTETERPAETSKTSTPTTQTDPARIRYGIKTEFGEFRQSDPDFDPENHGLCDALIFTTISFPRGGGREEFSSTIDGRSGVEGGEALSSLECFKTWNAMAHALFNDPGLTLEKRLLAGGAFLQIQRCIVGKDHTAVRDTEGILEIMMKQIRINRGEKNNG